MKTKLLFILLLLAQVGWGQEDVVIKPLDQNVPDYKSDTLGFNNYFFKKINEKLKSGNYHTEDIYNPINFTTITERMPKSNGSNKSYKLLNRSSLDYIQKGSEIHIEFDKDFIYYLTKNNKLDLQVIAYIIRKDNTIRPLEVNGFTEVKAIQDNNAELFKSGDSNINSVENNYEVRFLTSTKESFSGEVKLVWEEISTDDKIIITVQNKAMNNVGFSTTLVFDDFGWKQSQSSGLSFIQTPGADSGFSPAGNIGFAFRYVPRKTNPFFYHFISPAFGPEMNIYQIENNTNVGIGGFITTFNDVLKISVGTIINGENQGKFYFGFGLNFIQSYSVISGLLSKTNS